MAEIWNPRLFLYAGHSGDFGIDDLDHTIDHTLEPKDFHSESRSPPPMDSNDFFIDAEFSSSVSSSIREPTPDLVMPSVNPLELEQTFSVANISVATPFPVKKSRGRKVPVVQNGGLILDGQRGGRGRRHICVYCGGGFFRGEHLKRHVRSIHTHEKRSSVSLLNCLLI